MTSVCFQGKPFNITVIQGYAPTIDTEEDEVEWFYEDLQVSPDGQRSLAGYSPWGLKESDMTEVT